MTAEDDALTSIRNPGHGKPKPGISTVRHPDPVVRRAIRVLRMLGELHVGGFQRLRGMPYLSGSGAYWRLEICPREMFHRTHGALLWEPTVFDPGWNEFRAVAELVARFSTGEAEDGSYFGWTDAANDDARGLATKFVERFPDLARRGEGWDHEYAGWFQRLIGLAEKGWMPVVFDADRPPRGEGLYLDDLRPAGWREPGDRAEPVLPLPPPGDLDRPWNGS